MKTSTVLWALLLATACKNDGNDAASGGTADEDEGIEGRRWCVQAAGARGFKAGPPPADVWILQLNTGEPLRDCKCYCLEDSQTMGLGASGAMLNPTDQAWYNAERNALRNGAAAACWNRVSAIGGLTFPMGYTDCNAAVTDETYPLLEPRRDPRSA